MASTSRILDGIRVAVTRAGDRGTPLADALRAVGATVHDLPLTRIESLPDAPLAHVVHSLRDYQWVLLTSVNGVTHLAMALREPEHLRPLRKHAMQQLQVATVGAATSASAHAHGWRTAVMPEQFTAEALLDALAERDDIDGARMLYPAAEGARDVLPDGLRALGAIVDVVPVYRSAPDPDGCRAIGRLAVSGEIDLVTLAAPSAVDALLDAVPPELASRLPVACIGPVTARAARRAGFPVRVESTAATVDGFVKSIVASFAD